MASIDWLYVLIAGVAAGATLLVAQLIYHFAIMGSDWWFFRAFAHPIRRISAVAPYMGTHAAKGIALVWLYAVTQATLGSGVTAAAMIGFAYWIIGSALPFVSLSPLITKEFGPPFSGRWMRSHVVDSLSCICAASIGSIIYP